MTDEVVDVFRAEHGRAVAVLARVFGDLSVAEDAVQDAFVAALERWPIDGLPNSPAGWIILTAKRKALDRLRSEQRRSSHHHEAARQAELRRDDPDDVPMTIADDTLRLIFLCCHPALSPDARVGLTLRLVGGLSTDEIARAFLVPLPTMAQRLVRAKAKIKAAGIALRLPDQAHLAARVDGVMAVLYLIFNEGYRATSGAALMRADLCREAIRLTRLLHDLRPDDPEVRGLLALMLLIDARRAGRVDDHGELVTLDRQDRSRWHPAMIAEGHALVRACLEAAAAGTSRPGRYQLQAAIQAVHTDAPITERTDWGQIVALYDQLLRLDPSPIVALNRAVAVAELDGPQVALALIDRLPLAGYSVFHVARAEMLARLDERRAARQALAEAIAATDSEAERRHLTRRRDELA